VRAEAKEWNQRGDWRFATDRRREQFRNKSSELSEDVNISNMKKKKIDKKNDFK